MIDLDLSSYEFPQGWIVQHCEWVRLDSGTSTDRDDGGYALTILSGETVIAECNLDACELGETWQFKITTFTVTWDRERMTTLHLLRCGTACGDLYLQLSFMHVYEDGCC